MKKIVMISLLVCVLGYPVESHATIITPCEERVPENMLTQSEAVFTGKVIFMENLERINRPDIATDFTRYIIVIEAAQSWKGVNYPNMVLYYNYDSKGNPNPFRMSDEYLVYGRTVTGGKATLNGLLTVGNCTVIPIEKAQEDIHALNALKEVKNWEKVQ